MQQIITIIEQGFLKTYQLTISPETVKQISTELKKLSPSKIVTVRWDMKATETLILGRCGYDEYLGIYENNIREALAKKYIVLYHLLFGKYQYRNGIIFRKLFLYLSNQYGLKDERGIDIFKISGNTNGIYDEEISTEKNFK